MAEFACIAIRGLYVIVSEKRDHFATKINFELNVPSKRAHSGLQNNVYSIENGASCPKL